MGKVREQAAMTLQGVEVDRILRWLCYIRDSDNLSGRQLRDLTEVIEEIEKARGKAANKQIHVDSNLILSILRILSGISSVSKLLAVFLTDNG